MAQTQLEKIYEPAEVEVRWGQFWLDHKFFQPQSGTTQAPYTIVIPPPNVTGSLRILETDRQREVEETLKGDEP